MYSSYSQNSTKYSFFHSINCPVTTINLMLLFNWGCAVSWITKPSENERAPVQPAAVTPGEWWCVSALLLSPCWAAFLLSANYQILWLVINVLARPGTHTHTPKGVVLLLCIIWGSVVCLCVSIYNSESVLIWKELLKEHEPGVDDRWEDDGRRCRCSFDMVSFLSWIFVSTENCRFHSALHQYKLHSFRPLIKVLCLHSMADAWWMF